MLNAKIFLYHADTVAENSSQIYLTLEATNTLLSLYN